jgi:hypothetical protein
MHFMIFFSFIFLLRILKQGMTFGTAEPEGLGIKSSEGSLAEVTCRGLCQDREPIRIPPASSSTIT